MADAFKESSALKQNGQKAPQQLLAGKPREWYEKLLREEPKPERKPEPIRQAVKGRVPEKDLKELMALVGSEKKDALGLIDFANREKALRTIVYVKENAGKLHRKDLERIVDFGLQSDWDEVIIQALSICTDYKLNSEKIGPAALDMIQAGKMSIYEACKKCEIQIGKSMMRFLILERIGNKELILTPKLFKYQISMLRYLRDIDRRWLFRYIQDRERERIVTRIGDSSISFPMFAFYTLMTLFFGSIVMTGLTEIIGNWSWAVLGGACSGLAFGFGWLIPWRYASKTMKYAKKAWKEEDIRNNEVERAKTG